MSKRKILVVEDEAIVALDIKERLCYLGYEVTAAVPSSDLALKSVEAQKPDLILMDIQIQGPLDGIETADHIRRRYNIPIVFLTANSDDATLQRAKLTGPYGFLLKPFEERELHSTIEMATYRHQLEQRVYRSEVWLRTALQSIGDAVIATDGEGRVKLLNQEAERLTGWSEKECVGLSVERILSVHGSEQAKLFRKFKEVLEGKREIRRSELPIELETKYGAAVPVEQVAAPITGGSGEILGGIIVLRDVTVRITAEKELQRYQDQLEELVQERTAELESAYEELKREISERKAVQLRLDKAEKMQAVALLAGGVAHDLNNILGPLVGYPALLLERLQHDGELAGMAKKILEAARMATEITQDLLTLSRRGSRELVSLELNQVVDEFMNSLTCEQLKGERPELEIEAQTWPGSLTIKGSSHHLFKVIMNLVVNAAEAIDSGGKITIATSRTRLNSLKSGFEDVEQGNYVVLSVSDTGSGVSPEDLPKIFEPYYSKKEVGRSGTGLGLAVVYGIVKDHHGYYDVISEPGKGTEFLIYFPECREVVPQETTQSEISQDGYRLLVVDDDKNMRTMTLDLVRSLGYSGAAVNSGEEAVKFIREQPVDALLLDMNLGYGIDGLDTYLEVAKLQPGVKAIVMSGYASDERVRSLQQAAKAPFVSKPFTLQHLTKALKEIFPGTPEAEEKRALC